MGWCGNLAVGMLALLLSGCGLLTLGNDPSYVHESAKIYDEARLVHREQFSEQLLSGLFKDFVERECSNHSVARLTISTNRKDLEDALTRSFPEANPVQVIRGGGFRLEFRDPEIGQLWCLDGNATALVRRNDQISRYQMEGQGEAREVTISGAKLTLVGFDLGGNPPSRVSIYSRVDILPQMELAAAFRNELEAKVDIPTFLILRTDSFFVEDDGPSWDLFTSSLPAGSGKKFLDNPYVICPPKATGGHCLLVSEPPKIPAEDWGRVTRDRNQ